MKHATLEVRNQKFSYDVDGQTQELSFDANIDPKTAIGQLADQLKPLNLDAVVLTNETISAFSDTVVLINGIKTDIGIELTNQLDVVVVSQHSVAKFGLDISVKAQVQYDQWHLNYYGVYHDKKEYGQESLLTLGNGFFGLRGAFVEANESKDYYPGTYIAGLFDQLTTNIEGRDVENEDFVNAPNAQYLSFQVENGDVFDLEDAEIDDLYKSLDFKSGELKLDMIVKLPDGKRVRVETTKYADMINWHHYSIMYQLTPLNFTGNITLVSKLDGSVINANVDRYKDFKSRHLDIIRTEEAGTTNYMFAQTKTSKVKLAIATDLHIPDDKTIDIGEELRDTTDKDIMVQTLPFMAKENETYTFTKDVVMYTSLETKDDLENEVYKGIQNANFKQAKENSQKVWRSLWDESDIVIKGDIMAQKLTRMNIFHAYVTATENSNSHLDATVPARGLHGEAYRGHYFWDELFVLPFYTQHYPRLTRQLLMYRYKRLNEAKKYAKSDNLDGAMYPWQSAMYGDEQAQVVHLNTQNDTWDADYSRLQRHISLAIAYNIWYYFHTTLDVEFIQDYGMEMLLEIAEMWISKAQYNPDEDRYDIDGVMGPDEFHEAYPDSSKPGLNNNAYTNMMVIWLFEIMEQLAHSMDPKTLKKIINKTEFDPNDFNKMEHIRHRLKLDINDDGIIGQFDGYFKLKPLDLDAYKKKYGNISRIDRILKAEGKSPNDYQVAKQADALMAMYNISLSHINAIFKDLGYTLPDDYLTKNVKYYLARTTHGSTLSRIVYAELALLDDNMPLSWELFEEALTSDYYDIQGGTTAEGIHLGVMGATIIVTEREYAGVDDRGDVLEITPHLPKSWQGISFKRYFQGIHFEFNITPSEIVIKANQDTEVSVEGQKIQLQANQAKTVQHQNVGANKK